MKHILVLENYRESHPVFHLKTANTTKQMKLPFGEGAPQGTLFTHMVHMAIYNVQQSLLLSRSFPAGELKQMQASQQRCRVGKWKMETM